MRTALKCLLLAVVLLLPSTVFAQATLTGTVRDASGAVLPGVTVEAASPALIEKVRSAVTDGSGQYRIIDLQPGTYSLTFTLPGFNTVKRDGVELTGSQTLTIPADMKVGGLEETITVTGETPVVDVQNATRQLVMKDDVIQTIPATRAAGALLNATPGIVVGETGAALSPTMTSFNARSSTINSTSIAGEGRYAINGFPLTAARSGGFASVVYDTVNAEEVAITVGGGLGESDIGGPLMNIVPKSGGNSISGSAFLSTAGDWSSSNNITSDLKALNPNLKDSAGIIGSYDANVSLGGPIVKDKVWFYGSYRKLDTSVPQDGIVANKYAGDPTHWDWAPDDSVTSRLVQGRSMIIGRLTGQFGKNRARFYSEYQTRCEGSSLTLEGDGCHKRGEDWVGLGNNQAPTQMSPEATSTAGRGYFDVPFYVNQGTWTNTASNKLLFDAGIQFFRYQPIFGHPSPDAVKGLIPVTQQLGAPFAPVANYRYRAVESWGPAKGATDDLTGSVSYVTGAHNTKIGYQYRMLDLQDDDLANDTQLGYRFNGTTPNAVSYYLPEMGRRTITKTHGLYVQDTWTVHKLTVQGALRWDRASSFAPVEGNGTFGKTSFLNPQAITIQETKGVDAYNDLTPRVGLAYDVFGNGKTALKLNWGKYLAYAANDSPYTSTNPGATIVRNVLNRGWNASVLAGGNGDLVVDCNLLNPDLNGECAAVTGNSRNFGKAGSATQVDPAVLSGWGVRPGDTQTTVTVQQEVLPRVSADFSYTHRRFHGFFVTDDINRNPATSYESYTLTAPQDARLAGGGGYPITVFVPTAAANLVTPQTILRRESYYGDERISKWDGFEVTLNARMSNGLQTQVGTSTGRAFVDTCETATKFNNVNAGLGRPGLAAGAYAGPNPRGCHNVEPWQTTLRGSASYTVPKIDVLVSAVVRSQPNALLGTTAEQTANWQVPNSVIAAALGHLPPGATATGTTIIELSDGDHRIYADERRTQLDMRFAKILRFGRTRTDIGVDLNNVTNSNYALGWNNTYIYNADNAARASGWGTPTSIVNPRFVRLNFTVNF